jgi:lambda repressor-like predicted transcriptional regulator
VDGLSGVQFNSAIGAVGLSAIGSQQQRPHPAMDAAAKLLGMSASDLRSAMQSGQSLASIASSKGISQDALTSAMATAIEEANPTITADQATKVATSIATRTPPAGDADSAQGTSGTQAAGGHHHHHHHGGAAAMDAAASTLGVSATDLASSLQGGQSLATIAKSKGVSLDDLVKAMATALQGTDSNLSSEQATSIATQMANRTPGSQDGPWAATSGSVTGASTYSVTA